MISVIEGSIGSHGVTLSALMVDLIQFSAHRVYATDLFPYLLVRSSHRRCILFKAREDINLDADEARLNYDIEKKPLKAQTAAPKDVDFMSELMRGR